MSTLFFPAEEGVAIVKSTNNHTTCNRLGDVVGPVGTVSRMQTESVT